MGKKATTSNTATVVAERVTGESGIADEHLPAVVAYLAHVADEAMTSATVELLRKGEDAALNGSADRCGQVLSVIFGEAAVNGLTPGRKYLAGHSKRDVEYYHVIPDEVTYGAGPGQFAWINLPEATAPAAEEEMSIRY